MENWKEVLFESVAKAFDKIGLVESKYIKAVQQEFVEESIENTMSMSHLVGNPRYDIVVVEVLMTNIFNVLERENRVEEFERTLQRIDWKVIPNLSVASLISAWAHTLIICADLLVGGKKKE